MRDRRYKKRRSVDNYPHRFLVLRYNGVEDEFICLDTENEKICSLSKCFGDREVADSFDEWFDRDILARSKKKKT